MVRNNCHYCNGQRLSPGTEAQVLQHAYCEPLNSNGSCTVGWVSSALPCIQQSSLSCFAKQCERLGHHLCQLCCGPERSTAWVHLLPHVRV